MSTVYVTAPSESAAEIAQTVVDDRLAACVNQFPCQSTYRWDGDVRTDDETILLIKTTAEGYRPLVDRLVELHPYDVPCIERFDEAHIHDPFAAWITDSVSPHIGGDHQ
ncbi:divalent-cation tolerance protein CutA [Halorubraceae archaeon YAN]|nr:divalent-cation tolerance protein CutA [Halorubraceae archaeon YAN]